MAILEIRNLNITFSDKKKPHRVVENLNLTLEEGDRLGLVGESGSGKTMSALAAAGLLRQKNVRLEGEILLDGQNILTCTPQELRRLQGSRIGMIFQEPMTSLNPTRTIGWQVEETLRLHTSLTSEERRKRAMEALRDVELEDAERIYNAYPHALSGGQRQRVMIAAAMISRPKLLLADEPTTALDVTVQQQMMELLRKLNETYGTAILFISHDLALVRSLCSRMLVLQDGKAVEEGASEKLFTAPEQLYTRELIEAVPKFERIERAPLKADAAEVLCVSDLCAFYPKEGGGFFRKKEKKEVLHHISFRIRQGEIIGLVGESGCGKSTLARTLLGLHRDYTGTVSHTAKHPQMVFQDAGSALNPSRTVEWILEEPLRNCTDLTAQQRRECVREMLWLVKLDESLQKRYPQQLSGGQRQRVCIAAALMLHPEFLIADEPVSALDVTVQKQILALMQEIVQETGVSILLISHDLRVVYQMCDRVLVMKDGAIVEAADAEEIYKNPQHPYTKELLRSAGADM
ncbi:MAG: ABC transporter ATP-binding protein [Ruminococcus sp.]|nr:ABC transporter ATP-binding protein [Ruminococcus sp.]